MFGVIGPKIHLSYYSGKMGSPPTARGLSRWSVSFFWFSGFLKEEHRIPRIWGVAQLELSLP